MIGAGIYSIGLSMICIAVHYRTLWPEIWTMSGEVKKKDQIYVFGGILLVAGALLLGGLLYDTQIEVSSAETSDKIRFV